MVSIEDTLRLTDNSKTKFKPNHFNTVGLTHGLPENGGTCPGATSGPGGCLALKREGGVNATCYIDKLVKAYPAFGKVLRFNTDLLANKTQAEMEVILTNTVTLFIKKSKNTDLYFRISTSGDIFSEDYARAWANTINSFPQVQFWTYTRWMPAAALLADCRNLALYLSADRVNYAEVIAVYEILRPNHNNVGICYMGDGAPSIKRWVKCPEVSGKIKNLPERGACAKCRLCFTYNDNLALRNIQFPIH